jgi:hypothetical protein
MQTSVHCDTVPEAWVQHCLQHGVRTSIPKSRRSFDDVSKRSCAQKVRAEGLYNGRRVPVPLHAPDLRWISPRFSVHVQTPEHVPMTSFVLIRPYAKEKDYRSGKFYAWMRWPHLVRG